MSIIHVSLTKDVLSLIPCQVDQLHVFVLMVMFLATVDSARKVIFIEVFIQLIKCN